MAEALTEFSTTLPVSQFLDRARARSEAARAEAVEFRKAHETELQNEADARRIQRQIARHRLDAEQAARDRRTEEGLRRAEQNQQLDRLTAPDNTEAPERQNDEQRYRYSSAVDVEHRAAEHRYEQVDEKLVRGNILDVEA